MMIHRKVLFTCLGILCASAGFYPTAVVQANEISAARQDELNSLVLQDCGSCHGMTLNGGLGLPLTQQALRGKTPQALVGIILDGIKDTPMPPWRGLLSEDEALWIAKALQQGQIK